MKILNDGTVLGGVFERDGRFFYDCEQCSTSYSGSDEYQIEMRADAHEREHREKSQAPSTTSHTTPRMHQRPDDPAYQLLDNVPVTQQKVHRASCYICRDREFARMGMPLCNPCCACAALGKTGHVPADDSVCDDCGHEVCQNCMNLPPQENICTCASPCCEVDIGVGIMTCGGQHCPTHGTNTERDHESPVADQPTI